MNFRSGLDDVAQPAHSTVQLSPPPSSSFPQLQASPGSHVRLRPASHVGRAQTKKVRLQPSPGAITSPSSVAKERGSSLHFAPALPGLPRRAATVPALTPLLRTSVDGRPRPVRTFLAWAMSTRPVVESESANSLWLLLTLSRPPRPSPSRRATSTRQQSSPSSLREAGVEELTCRRLG